jgi:hypothetical protein
LNQPATGSGGFNALMKLAMAVVSFRFLRQMTASGSTSWPSNAFSSRSRGNEAQFSSEIGAGPSLLTSAPAF